jgi:hypothetical protein
MFDGDDKRIYHVVYLLPNHPGDNDGGIWKVTAKNPDDALGQFADHIKPQKAKIIGCTEDYGAACELLLNGHGY